jgi:predicted DNA-binding protein
MPQLTLDRLSARTIGRLNDLAQRQGRSKEDVASEILEQAMQVDPKARGEAARRVRAMTPPVEQSDSTKIVRSLRDE